MASVEQGSKDNKVNCFKCRHFKTTWNPQFPRSCSAYGFKTKEIPSNYVIKATGQPCVAFSSSEVSHQPQQTKRVGIDIKL